MFCVHDLSLITKGDSDNSSSGDSPYHGPGDSSSDSSSDEEEPVVPKKKKKGISTKVRYMLYSYCLTPTVLIIEQLLRSRLFFLRMPASNISKVLARYLLIILMLMGS